MNKTQEQQPSANGGRARPKRFADVVSEADGITIRVYPMAFTTLEQHGDELTAVLRSIGNIDWTKAQEVGLSAASIWWALAPLAGRQVLRLASDCCVPSLVDLDPPVDVVTEVVVRWVELSFMSGGLRSMIGAAESLLGLFGGANADQLPQTTATKGTSPSSSGSGSPPTTSTAVAEPTVPLTAVGPSSSLETTVGPPAASSATSVPANS